MKRRDISHDCYLKNLTLDHITVLNPNYYLYAQELIGLTHPNVVYVN